ncbi:hypothetical protein Tco_0769317, partial [Tanacetum coccineum]
DDGDSSGDDADGEDEDDDDDEEEEEHLALTDSAIVVPVDEPVFPPEGTKPVIPPPFTNITIGARITIRPQASISFPPEAERLARCTALPAHLLPPSSGCPTQVQTLKIASTQALIDAVTTALSLPPLPPSLYIPPPVDHRDEIPESEQPPRKRLCLSTLGSRYEVGESSTARPTRDPTEAVPEIALVTLGEVNTRVTELVELHEHDTQDLYALLRMLKIMHQAKLVALRETDRKRQAQMVETLRVIRDMRREVSGMQAKLLSVREQQRRARQPGPEARIPDHQDASGDADRHI